MTKPWPRRLLVLASLATFLVATIGATTWLARFAPLSMGSMWHGPTSTTDAWRLDHNFLDSEQVIIARNEHLARIDLAFTIRNDSSRGIEMLDPEFETDPVCFWIPVDATFSPPSWRDDHGVELDPPFTLDPGEEVLVRVAGQIGTENDGPCTMAGLGSIEVELPFRYSIFGMTRSQRLPLDLTLALSDNPDQFMELNVEKLEPLR